MIFPAQYRKTTQGRCRPCKAAYRWEGPPLLRVALCPHCKKPLSRTTRHYRGAWRGEHPLELLS